MTTQRVIALLGRRDAPTDAVEEYCRYLGGALGAHEISIELRRVPWDSLGWPESLKGLRLQAQSLPPGTWFLVQYTALAWSVRGFPLRFLHVLKTLRSSKACVAVVFHDVEPFPGLRLVDRFRRSVQLWVMRRAVALSDRGIFTVPMEKISWLAAESHNATFIPVGPNLPIPLPAPIDAAPSSAFLSRAPSVAVFGVTGGAEGVVESQKVLAAVRAASGKLGRLGLSVFGRNADSAGLVLREGLRDLPVEFSVEGVLQECQVVEKLSSCDVLLFVRGAISSRRSSAIAGIACGLPVIAWSGTETAPPITDAGVVFVAQSKDSSESQEFLNAALIRVLSDSAYRAELAARSRAAYLEHFSWPSVATRFAVVLNSSTR